MTYSFNNPSFDKISKAANIAIGKKKGGDEKERCPFEFLRMVMRDVADLRLHGSNTIGAKLAPALATVFKNQVNNEIVIDIKAKGSGTGFKNLTDKKCDIATASRKIKPKEIQDLQKNFGDMASKLSEHILGLDGVVVIVNRTNPIRELSKEQIAKIFAGEITDWYRVKDEANRLGKINVYTRDDQSGAYDTFKNLVLKPFKLKLTPDAKSYSSNEKLEYDVSQDINGIGFTSLPYVKKSEKIAVLDGASAILPNELTIATEEYPLSHRLYLYLPPRSKNSYATKFIDFALSSEGQQIVKQEGFIDLTIKALLPTRRTLADVPTNAIQQKEVVEEYFNLIKDTKKLSTTFRFLPKSEQLDNKALRDIDRIREFYQTHQNQNTRFLLLGFTDNEGEYKENKERSLKYARSIYAKMVREAGIAGNVVEEVKGYGEELPIASNDTEWGKARNNRVEIWLKE